MVGIKKMIKLWFIILNIIITQQAYTMVPELSLLRNSFDKKDQFIKKLNSVEKNLMLIGISEDLLKKKVNANSFRDGRFVDELHAVNKKSDKSKHTAGVILEKMFMLKRKFVKNFISMDKKSTKDEKLYLYKKVMDSNFSKLNRHINDFERMEKKQKKVRNELGLYNNYLKKLKKDKKNNLEKKRIYLAALNDLKLSDKKNKDTEKYIDKNLESNKSYIFDKKGSLEFPFDVERSSKLKIKTFGYNVSLPTSGWSLISKVKSEKVSAVFSGKVIFLGKLDGYGKSVILDHGHSYYSIYSFLSAFSVKLGDNINSFGEIGLSGILPNQRSGIYLELRHFSKSLKLSEWFRI